MTKTRLLIAYAIIALSALCVSAQVSFSGSSQKIYEITPASNTGLNRVYVLYDTQGVSMSYTASTDDEVTWYQYGEGGGAYATEVEGVTTSGRTTTLAQVIKNKGYILEEGDRRYYVWVINYADYYLRLHSMTCEPASDCGTATLNVRGTGPDLEYFTITGVRRVLDRELKLSYNTMTWNDDATEWQRTDTTETIESFKNTIVVPAPLCNTQFTLSGDRFLEYWNEDVEITSDEFLTAAVDVQTTAEQEQREVDNEKSDGTSTDVLGGSAPCHITFTAYCTQAVIHKEWQMATDPDFNDIQLRLNQEVVDETYTEAGTFYWRFIGSNYDGSCEAVSQTYTVNIGISELYCPNVFSPGTTTEVNDIWKVSYKSIVRFHCWIFNRWGNQIIEFSDPSQGWDGTYRGKLVNPGVYYYVIEAEGADGKHYKLRGDINIIRFKENLNTGGSGDDVGGGDVVE